ncbi:hypothetical protein [Janthinobacterium rivuli]
MRKIYIGLIVVLLVAIVGYLALDHRDKQIASERDQAFDQKFAK